MFTGVSYGQTVKVVGPIGDVNVGDGFVVQVKFDSGANKINAASGSLSASSGLEIKDVRYGDSVLSLWPVMPKIDNGVLHFEGGVPGGWSGSDGLLLTAKVVAKVSGAQSIKVEGFKAFLNDGRGTELSSIMAKQLSLHIVKAGGVAPKDVNLASEDKTGPELFAPIISHQRDVYDDKYFVSFQAVDKLSGVDHYDVSESPFLLGIVGLKSLTKNAVNPVVLSYQYWPSRVVVTVYDKSGNSTFAAVRKPHDIYVELALALFGLGLVGFVLRKRKSNA